nr:agamous-like MADS-box protein AGL61 [Ipomoea batatas]
MGKGKAKIAIKKIESLQARNVCFTKRRKGLFKKAAELGHLFPEVRIAAVVFSPAGNPYVLGDLSEMEKLLTMEESRKERLTSEETEKGEEENAGSDPVVEITAVTNSTQQEITESGDMTLNPSMVTDFTMKEVTENKNARFCVQDTTFASSSHCLEMPIVDSDFCAADFDGFDEEGVFFISTFLGFRLLLLLLQPFAKLELEGGQTAVRQENNLLVVLLALAGGGSFAVVLSRKMPSVGISTSGREDWRVIENVAEDESVSGISISFKTDFGIASELKQGRHRHVELN